jgi:hypothetical protein
MFSALMEIHRDGAKLEVRSVMSAAAEVSVLDEANRLGQKFARGRSSA